MQVCLWALCHASELNELCHAVTSHFHRVEQALDPSVFWRGCVFVEVPMKQMQWRAPTPPCREPWSVSVPRHGAWSFGKLWNVVFFFQRAKKNEKSIVSERIAALSRSLWSKTVVSTESNFGNSEGQGQHQRALLARLGHVECQLLARRPNPPQEAGGKKMKKGKGEEVKFLKKRQWKEKKYDDFVWFRDVY